MASILPKHGDKINTNSLDQAVQKQTTEHSETIFAAHFFLSSYLAIFEYLQACIEACILSNNDCQTYLHLLSYFDFRYREFLIDTFPHEQHEAMIETRQSIAYRFFTRLLIQNRILNEPDSTVLSPMSNSTEHIETNNTRPMILPTLGIEPSSSA